MASEDPQLPIEPEGSADFAADAETRIADARPRVGLSARARFAAILVAVLLVHAAVVAVFLLRDRESEMKVAVNEETPVEVIVEKPPEQPKPVPPPPPPPPPEKKPPPPPPPKEDLSMAKSAPRKENDETLKTDKLQDKTSVPKAPQPPQEGTPQPQPAAAPPKEAAPDQTKEETAGKEEDKSKPDAEALDKAAPKSTPTPTPKPPKSKAAKAQPKPNQKTRDLFASLSGSSALPQMTFAKPTPKTKVYGGTEDVRWMSTVEGMLEDKVGKLPRTAHWQDGGTVAICFHVDVSGRVTVKEWCTKSGYPDIDGMAMRALMAAAPFPPPPPGIERGLVWVTKFDGQLPSVHISRR